MSNDLEKEVENTKPKKATKKKDPIVIAIVVAIVIVLIGAFILTDYQARNPKIGSLNDATNVIFSQNVIANNPYIIVETPVDIVPTEPEEIDGEIYFPVQIITYPVPVIEEGETREDWTDEERAAIYETKDRE